MSVHMVQFTNRGLPHYRYIKRLLDDGYIGQPYHGYFYWPTGWGPAEEVNTYHWAVRTRVVRKAPSTSWARTCSTWPAGTSARWSA